MLKTHEFFKGFVVNYLFFLVLRFRNNFLQSFFRGFFLLDFTMAAHTYRHIHCRDMRQQLSVSLASHLQILIGSPVCALSLVASSIFNKIWFNFLLTLVLIMADCYCTSKHCHLKIKISFEKTYLDAQIILLELIQK